MKVKELIDKLKELPEEATIGMCYLDNEGTYCEFENITDIDKNENWNDFKRENFDYEEEICDYYIG